MQKLSPQGWAGLGVVAQAAGLLALGLAAGRLGLALACAAAAAALWLAAAWASRRGPPLATALTPLRWASLALVTAAQLPLAPQPLLAWANLMLVLSLLPALRSVVAVLLPAVAWLALGGWLAWQGRLPALALAALALQAGLLAAWARHLAEQARERFDMQFLVRAMGSDGGAGVVRLGLEAVRADTALGQRLQGVQQRMAGLLREVRAATGGMHQAASELQASGERLRQRTEQSASGMRDAAMTLEQITLIVKSSAQAAQQARAMAADASQRAAQGGALFGQVTGRMQDIDQASRRITDIIGVIDGIAFQTNILALNAAVEAARAGEQGRGFSVVAQEVRSLALRASAAAAEVKALISHSMDTVKSGTALVSDAGQAMQGIITAVDQVGQVFQTLSADTHEHAGSIESVTQAVMALDEATRQNVTEAETARRVAAGLLEQGQGLEQVMGCFKLGNGLGAPVAPVAAVAPVELPPAPRFAVARAPAAAAPAPAASVEFF